MDKQTFNIIVERYQQLINEIEKTGCEIHQETNHKYSGYLPYGFHLNMVASYVAKYGYLVAENDADVLTLFAASYLHDSIEDARLSYNDVVKLVKNLKTEGETLDNNAKNSFETLVPDIVYALTNEKGRTREERANEKYYKGIRETRFAPFVKMCDRLANVCYSKIFPRKSRMLNVYRQEHSHFMDSIGKKTIPKEMEIELMQMFSEEIEFEMVNNK